MIRRGMRAAWVMASSAAVLVVLAIYIGSREVNEDEGVQ